MTNRQVPREVASDLDRGRQVIRQWKLLRLLEAHRGGMTVADAHRLLDEACVERTVRRDFVALEAAGFPLEEHHGVWRLVRGGAGGVLTLPIEPTQVVALLMSEALLSGSTMSEPVSELRTRLEAMLAPRARAWVGRLRRLVAVTPAPSIRADAHDERVLALEAGIHGSRRVRITYWSPESGTSTRTIEPRLLWHAAGGLYVVAWDARSEQIRTFAVQRVRAAELLDETFTPDPEFDPSRFVRVGFGVFHGETWRIVVEFREEVAHLLREREWHPSQRLEDIPGGVRATWNMAGIPEIARWLAGFGGQARVIAPTVLIERVRALHADGLAAHDACPSPGGHPGA